MNMIYAPLNNGGQVSNQLGKREVKRKMSEINQSRGSDINFQSDDQDEIFLDAFNPDSLGLLSAQKDEARPAKAGKSTERKRRNEAAEAPAAPATAPSLLAARGMVSGLRGTENDQKHGSHGRVDHFEVS